MRNVPTSRRDVHLENTESALRVHSSHLSALSSQKWNNVCALAMALWDHMSWPKMGKPMLKRQPLSVNLSSKLWVRPLQVPFVGFNYINYKISGCGDHPLVFPNDGQLARALTRAGKFGSPRRLCLWNKWHQVHVCMRHALPEQVLNKSKFPSLEFLLMIDFLYSTSTWMWTPQALGCIFFFWEP